VEDESSASDGEEFEMELALASDGDDSAATATGALLQAVVKVAICPVWPPVQRVASAVHMSDDHCLGWAGHSQSAV